MNSSDHSGNIDEFLAKGGKILKLIPRYKGFKEKTFKEKPLCQKCEINSATRRFSDDEGNRYSWCQDCYDE